MKFPPDEDLRARALDPATSFIIEAPAGSGKTTLLVNRFLRLLTTVERPESVVAMTFTRKAAAEMRERILKRLSAAANGESDDLAAAVLKHSRAQRWNLDRDTSRLQIQTIDSLCAMLARQMPVISQLGGSAEVVEHVDELYLLAARRTMAGLAEGSETEQALFRRLSLHFESDLTALEKQIVAMLAKREQWRHVDHSFGGADVQDFCDLLFRAERELGRVFQLAGKVDFTAVTRAAIQALGEAEAPSDLLYALDYRIQHVLVDEFQDTSYSQYELIEALTGQWSDGDGRTLFVVGDPMQSIYMFRQAELSLFLKCWHKKRLGAVRLRQIRLLANFRSTTQLVEWTQKSFAPITPPEDDANIGAVKMRPAEADPGKSGPDVVFQPFIDDAGNDEAQAVVEILRQLPSRGDAAILVRSRSQLNSILPALRSSGIAYEAIEIDQLREQQHILDILSLTRAILHIGDRVAWLACLRAPWCGLTLANLSLLAEREPRTIFDVLGDPQKVWMLSPDGRERVIRLYEIMAQAVRSVGRLPLRELVRRTWMALGGPAALRHPVHRDDVETLLDLLEQFDEGGVIRDFSLLDAKLEFLYARSAPDANAVKVMTIHSAKGLEFDTVILPQLGAANNKQDKDLLVWSGDRVAARPRGEVEDGTPYDQITQDAKLKSKEELKRLLYVAVTRAKNRLYLSGCVRRTKSGALGKATEGSFLNLIYPRYKADFESLNRRSFKRDTSFSASGVPVTQLRRLSAAWDVPKLEPSVQCAPPLRSAPASGRSITYEWVGDTGRHIGTLVHQVLRRMGSEGAARWSTDRIGKMHALFRSELRRHGVAELDDAVAKVTRALTNTLSSERGRWILGEHAEKRTEWAISGRLGDTLINGSVDCSFRDGEGRLWIVDFKTSQHAGGNLERFVDEEHRRYRTQLENYASLISHLTPGPIWMGLYFPLHDAWREWAFVEETVAAS